MADISAERESEPALATRRTFLDTAIAAGGALAIAELLPGSTALAAPRGAAAPAAATPTPQPVPPPGSAPLTAIGVIASRGNKLRAVITVRNEMKSYATGPTQTAPVTATATAMLRYFEGYDPAAPDAKWPPPNPAGVPPPARPGPTLRCHLGDTVEITLLNHVNVEDFMGSLDSGEQGRHGGCDFVNAGTKTGSSANVYPDTDTFPNCLHGSSSANIHFHGTHVSPSTTADNVLINVRPDRTVTAGNVQKPFDQIFAKFEATGREPRLWTDLPATWQSYQKSLLKRYDATAPYRGGHGLPHDQQLWPQNEEAIAQGAWPQWHIGAYPYCFRIPKYQEDAQGRPVGVQMGQSPGTHWYHSHKHGSTAINSFNGMSGVLIIADDGPEGYDGKLKAYYGSAFTERVLIFQQIMGQPNLFNATGLNTPPGPPPILLNGQYAPTISVHVGETQLWRIVNANARSTVAVQFDTYPTSGGKVGLAFRQTAQDGVQFEFDNYKSSENVAIQMAPANRADVLVKGLAAGWYVMNDPLLGNPVLYVNVTASASTIAAKPFPPKESFPKPPNFLHDISPASVHLRRSINYGWTREPGRDYLGQGRGPTPTYPPNPPTPTPVPTPTPIPTAPPTSINMHPPHFTINGKQFENQVVNEVMLLGSHEEWTVLNTTTVGAGFPPGGTAHPFHIHINPFQIFEVYDPNTMTQPLKLSAPYVWWDTFAIPPAKFVTNPNGGYSVVPGYFKMRTRFVDFTGIYVQHCHILAHEDRGMMQLLQVVSNRTLFKHH